MGIIQGVPYATGGLMLGSWGENAYSFASGIRPYVPHQATSYNTLTCQASTLRKKRNIIIRKGSHTTKKRETSYNRRTLTTLTASIKHCWLNRLKGSYLSPAIHFLQILGGKVGALKKHGTRLRRWGLMRGCATSFFVLRKNFTCTLFRGSWEKTYSLSTVLKFLRKNCLPWIAW